MIKHEKVDLSILKDMTTSYRGLYIIVVSSNDIFVVKVSLSVRTVHKRSMKRPVAEK